MVFRFTKAFRCGRNQKPQDSYEYRPGMGIHVCVQRAKRSCFLTGMARWMWNRFAVVIVHIGSHFLFYSASDESSNTETKRNCSEPMPLYHGWISFTQNGNHNGATHIHWFVNALETHCCLDDWILTRLSLSLTKFSVRYSYWSSWTDGKNHLFFVSNFISSVSTEHLEC